MPFSLKQLGLSAGLAMAAMGAPVVAAGSTAAPVQAQAPSQAAPARDEARANEDSASYAAREARDPELAKFAGGDTIVIGSTVVAAVLIIVALALLL